MRKLLSLVVLGLVLVACDKDKIEGKAVDTVSDGTVCNLCQDGTSTSADGTSTAVDITPTWAVDATLTTDEVTASVDATLVSSPDTVVAD